MNDNDGGFIIPPKYLEELKIEWELFKELARDKHIVIDYESLIYDKMFEKKKVNKGEVIELTFE